jgi:hypothetical protein
LGRFEVGKTAKSRGQRAWREGLRLYSRKWEDWKWEGGKKEGEKLRR